MKILEELDPKTLNDNTELLITMTVEGTKNSAVLVLKLPSKTGKEILSFKDLYYVAKYPKAGNIKTINFDKNIEFPKLADNSKITIILNGEYSEIRDFIML